MQKLALPLLVLTGLFVVACSSPEDAAEPLSLSAVTSVGAEAGRPNIIFIMSDDHAQRAISAYGDSLIATPHIDRIANEGVLFEKAFVTNSICAPSRATLLTGKFSHMNGLRDNRDEFNGHQPSFPQMLQKQGYQTAVVGKWHLKTEPVGFDFWQILIGQGEYYSPRFRTPNGIVQHDGAYVTEKVTDIALEFLQNRDKNKPFMMLYHHKAPHRNWMPPVDDLDPDNIQHIPVPDSFSDDYAGRPAAEEADMRIADLFLSWDMKLQPGQYEQESGTGGGRGRDEAVLEATDGWNNAYARMTSEQKSKWDAFYDLVNAQYQKVKNDPQKLAHWKYQRYLHDYLATVRSVDDNIGRVLDYLDAEGLADNTLVVYTSDQGFYLGEHGWYDKRFMYEESMGTPLMMRYPAAVEPGQKIQQLVQNLDFAPTFLDFAGADIPKDMQGLSLKPMMTGTQKGGWRDGLYYHYYEYPHGWHRVNQHYGVRTKTHKLIYFYGKDHWELYDLQNDPGELNNRYNDPDYADVQARLHQQLQQLRQNYGDTTGQLDADSDNHHESNNAG